MLTMTFRQKRSSSGYSLRRKVVKKKLDEDFEYNFSKQVSVTKSTKDYSTKSTVTTGNSTVHTVPVPVHNSKNQKGKVEIKGSVTKKQRGRPKKLQVEAQRDLHSLPSLESTLKLVHLKEEKENPAVLYIESPDASAYATMGEVCGVEQQATMSVSHEEVVGETVDMVWKKIRVEPLETISGEALTLEEDEERGENGKITGQRVSLESDLDFEGEIVLELDVAESHAISSSNKCFEALISQKGINCKYQSKIEQQLQGLKHLSSDHKIECSECHKLLKPSSFRQHLRTHTGEKPFCCTLCEARFTRKGDVERHVRIVHNKQKPFKCPRCQRAFGDKKNLRWHLMNHDKKLFYICETCGFKFGKREYWENHVRFIHPVPGEPDSGEIHVDCEEEKEIADTGADIHGTSQAVESAILSIQDKDSTAELMGTFPIDQNSTRYVSLNSVDFCNYIKFEEFQSCQYEEDSGATDHVIIELNNGEDPELEVVASQSYKSLTELVNCNSSLHVEHPQNVAESQELPIIIETQDLPIRTSTIGANGAGVDADVTQVRHIITGILLGESGTVASDNSDGAVVHNFINAFIDVASPNSDETGIQGALRLLSPQEQC